MSVEDKLKTNQQEDLNAQNILNDYIDSKRMEIYPGNKTISDNDSSTEYDSYVKKYKEESINDEKARKETIRNYVESGSIKRKITEAVLGVKSIFEWNVSKEALDEIKSDAFKNKDIIEYYDDLDELGYTFTKKNVKELYKTYSALIEKGIEFPSRTLEKLSIAQQIYFLTNLDSKLNHKKIAEIMSNLDYEKLHQANHEQLLVSNVSTEMLERASGKILIFIQETSNLTEKEKSEAYQALILETPVRERAALLHGQQILIGDLKNSINGNPDALTKKVTNLKFNIQKAKNENKPFSQYATRTLRQNLKEDLGVVSLENYTEHINESRENVSQLVEAIENNEGLDNPKISNLVSLISQSRSLLASEAMDNAYEILKDTHKLQNLLNIGIPLSILRKGLNKQDLAYAFATANIEDLKRENPNIKDKNSFYDLIMNLDIDPGVLYLAGIAALGTAGLILGRKELKDQIRIIIRDIKPYSLYTDHPRYNIEDAKTEYGLNKGWQVNRVTYSMFRDPTDGRMKAFPIVAAQESTGYILDRRSFRFGKANTSNLLVAYPREVFENKKVNIQNYSRIFKKKDEVNQNREVFAYKADDGSEIQTPIVDLRSGRIVNTLDAQTPLTEFANLYYIDNRTDSPVEGYRVDPQLQEKFIDIDGNIRTVSEDLLQIPSPTNNLLPKFSLGQIYEVNPISGAPAEIYGRKILRHARIDRITGKPILIKYELDSNGSLKSSSDFRIIDDNSMYIDDESKYESFEPNYHNYARRNLENPIYVDPKDLYIVDSQTQEKFCKATKLKVDSNNKYILSPYNNDGETVLVDNVSKEKKIYQIIENGSNIKLIDITGKDELETQKLIERELNSSDNKNKGYEATTRTTKVIFKDASGNQILDGSYDFNANSHLFSELDKSTLFRVLSVNGERRLLDFNTGLRIENINLNGNNQYVIKSPFGDDRYLDKKNLQIEDNEKLIWKDVDGDEIDLNNFRKKSNNEPARFFTFDASGNVYDPDNNLIADSPNPVEPTKGKPLTGEPGSPIIAQKGIPVRELTMSEELLDEPYASPNPKLENIKRDEKLESKERQLGYAPRYSRYDITERYNMEEGNRPEVLLKNKAASEGHDDEARKLMNILAGYQGLPNGALDPAFPEFAGKVVSNTKGQMEIMQQKIYKVQEKKALIDYLTLNNEIIEDAWIINIALGYGRVDNPLYAVGGIALLGASRVFNILKSRTRINQKLTVEGESNKKKISDPTTWGNSIVAKGARAVIGYKKVDVKRLIIAWHIVGGIFSGVLHSDFMYGGKEMAESPVYQAVGTAVEQGIKGINFVSSNEVKKEQINSQDQSTALITVAASTVAPGTPTVNNGSINQSSSLKQNAGNNNPTVSSVSGENNRIENLGSKDNYIRELMVKVGNFNSNDQILKSKNITIETLEKEYGCRQIVAQGQNKCYFEPSTFKSLDINKLSDKDVTVLDIIGAQLASISSSQSQSLTTQAFMSKYGVEYNQFQQKYYGAGGDNVKAAQATVNFIKFFYQ